MLVKVIRTGSKGNSYALYSESGQILLLDLGIPKKEIIKAINYDISNVAGAIVSHCHKDHSLSADDFKLYGVPVIEPYKEEKLLQVKQIGNFKIRSFDLPHDGTENRGFLIEVDNQKVLYMTDFEYCKYSFKKSKINHMLIECNYQKEYVEHSSVNFSHKVKGHCSLDYTKRFIKDNETDSLRTVIMIHRGISTTNPDECVEEVEKDVESGVEVYMAEKGLEVELNMIPF